MTGKYWFVCYQQKLNRGGTVFNETLTTCITIHPFEWISHNQGYIRDGWCRYSRKTVLISFQEISFQEFTRYQELNPQK